MRRNRLSCKHARKQAFKFRPALDALSLVLYNHRFKGENFMEKSRLGLLQTEAIATLSDAELAAFERSVVKKGYVYYSDTPKVFAFKTGSAKLSFFEDGEEFIMNYLQKGGITILNEICALEFLEDSEIYTIDVDGLGEILQNKEFCEIYIKILTNIILMQRKITRSILFENAKGRIASFLIELANEQNFHQNGFKYVFLPFSLKVLASFIGLKRQSTSTAFNELVKDNVIKKVSQHEFLILDYNKLLDYCV